MISIQKKFLFIHIPKTGGNSIQSYLKDYSEDEIVVSKKQDGVNKFGVVNSKYDTIKHSTLRDYKLNIEQELYSDLFKFSTIRNPWDRAISFYFSPHRGISTWDKNLFKQIVEKMPLLDHFISTNSIGTGYSEIDFILRFESLQEDYRILCEKIDIEYKQLPVVNKSKRKNYREYYDNDERLINLIKDKYQKEINFGNYEF